MNGSGSGSEDGFPRGGSSGGGGHSPSVATATELHTYASDVPAAPGGGPTAAMPSPAPAPAPALQTRYEHYELLRRDDGSLWELGRGSMGATYKAFDTRLHCAVALKVIHGPLLQKRPVLRERFLREARVAARVRHPNIASVFHLGEGADGHCFYAMELIEGETLAELVRRRGPLPAPLTLDIALQVTHALIAAGQADLVHRDLKPANIMLSAGSAFSSRPGSSHSGNRAPENCEPCHANDPPEGGGGLLVKVIDFGLARSVHADADEPPLTVIGDFIGTPQYASPEQLAGDDEPIDIRSDIFSLGSTLWFLLTSRHPFSGRSLEEIHRQQLRAPPAAQLREARVPEPVVTLLAAMLAPDPDKRPPSPAVLAEMLGRCRQELLAASRAGPLPPLQPRQPRVSWLPLAVAGAALVLALVLALGAVGWVGWLRTRPLPAPPAPAPLLAPSKSVAVLPFDNLSDDKENAFLADGIQDDILTSLAKIRDLKVISRTSVLAYRDPATRRSLREVGRALNVANVLEGSVRRVGDRVRVTVQLIDARNDTHLWAETYDRTMSDALTLQGELSHEIANALRATLSPEENARVDKKPTENPEAYVLFLRGRDYQTRPDIQLETLRAAADLYEQAVAMDPEFAVAWARLSQVRSRSAFNYEPSAENYAHARDAADHALALQPDLGEGHLAKGFCLYWGDHAYDAALAEFALAIRALPNEPEVLRAVGYVNRRQGRWAEAQASFLKASVLGPRDPSALEALAHYHLTARQWPEAAKAYDHAVAAAPQAIDMRLTRALIDFHWKGDLTLLRNTLGQLPNGTDPEGQPTFERYELALLGGNFAGAESVLDDCGRESFPLGVGTPIHVQFLRGLVCLSRRANGDLEKARTCFEASRAHYEASARDYPREPLRHVDLALIYAALGWRDAAIGEGTYAAQIRPESVDAVSGVTVSLRLAKMYAMLGDADHALPLLEHLLTIPVEEWNGFSLNDLRRRPEWAALRRDARFEKLVAENGQPERAAK